MPTYDIIIAKTGTERHSVDADTPADAYRLYEEGKAHLKDDENQGVDSIKIVDRATGVVFDPDADLPAADDAPQPREYGVRLWATFRGVAEDTVTATSVEEAIEKAKALDFDDFSFTLEGREGDESISIFGPDADDPADDDPWSGDVGEVDRREKGDPTSWQACQIVKDLALLHNINNDTYTREQMSELIERAHKACSKDG